MKLWHITTKDGVHFKGYDRLIEAVIRAGTEEEARQLASRRGGLNDRFAWLDKTLTNCTDLLVDGEPGVVVASVMDG